MADFRDRVRAVMHAAISASINKPQAELSDQTNIIEDLGVKSVNFVRIIAALEDEFELEIPFMEFRRKKTIGEAIDYIVQLHAS